MAQCPAVSQEHSWVMWNKTTTSSSTEGAEVFLVFLPSALIFSWDVQTASWASPPLLSPFSPSHSSSTHCIVQFQTNACGRRENASAQEHLPSFHAGETQWAPTTSADTHPLLAWSSCTNNTLRHFPCSLLLSWDRNLHTMMFLLLIILSLVCFPSFLGSLYAGRGLFYPSTGSNTADGYNQLSYLLENLY